MTRPSLGEAVAWAFGVVVGLFWAAWVVAILMGVE